MSGARLELGRHAIVAFRRRVGALDERLPPGPDSLRRAAWAGLQDSMPRAALLSIHARVDGTQPSAWEDPELVQLWGPRYSAYVVPARDLAVFSLSRLRDDTRGRRESEELAERLAAFLAGTTMGGDEAVRGLGVDRNALRYAAPTGTVLMRWDGARRPTVWTVPRPDVEPAEARRELARRYLHVFGPTTWEAFAQWAGIGKAGARRAFEQLAEELVPVDTPIGPAWILASDEAVIRAAAGPPAAARLLPSGDAFFLLRGADRELLVPDGGRRGELWTSRVWPGALLVAGQIQGTWRRADAAITVSPWRRLTRAEHDAVEAEALALPLPGTAGRLTVRWGPA